MVRKYIHNGSAICYLAVTACLGLYGLSFDEPFAYTVRISLVGLVFFIWMLRAVPVFAVVIRRWCQQWREVCSCLWSRHAIFVYSLIVGLLFLGNILAFNPVSRHLNESLNRIVSGDVLFIGFVHDKRQGLITGLSQKGRVGIGDFRERGSYNEYNSGLPSFAAYYGGILAMILTTHYLFVMRGERQNTSLREYVMYEVFLVCVVALPALLFFADFIDTGTRGWIKSRFLEIPVYFIIFTFLSFVYRLGSHGQRLLVSVVLCAYMIIPFVATKRHKQIVENFGTFQDLLNR